MGSKSSWYPILKASSCISGVMLIFVSKNRVPVTRNCDFVVDVKKKANFSPLYIPIRGVRTLMLFIKN